MPFLQGFLIAASMCLTVGPQSLFVLRHGLSGRAPYLVALICTLADFLVLGGTIAAADTMVGFMPTMVHIAPWLAAAFLLLFGAVAVAAACRRVADRPPGASIVVGGLFAALLGAVAVSLLNPQVYVEIAATVGVGSMHFTPPDRWLFGLGAATVSPLWFFGIAYGARRLAPFLTSPRAVRAIDLAGGAAMLVLSLAIVGVELGLQA